MPEKLQTQQEQSTEQEQPPEGTEEQQEPKTYDEAYVKGLRDEAAQNRVKAGRATDLETALREAVISKVAASILQDPSTLEWTDEFNDPESGMPNPEAIRDAAEALAADKPHLSRVGGETLQGHRGEDSDAGEVNLAGLLRAGA